MGGDAPQPSADDTTVTTRADLQATATDRDVALEKLESPFTPEDVKSWLRSHGIDPERIVVGSLRGNRIDGSDTCQLLFVETPTEYADTYTQRSVTVAVPPWLATQLPPAPVDPLPIDPTVIAAVVAT